jgi:myo-inositol-1(or 4)-monophosphatase
VTTSRSSRSCTPLTGDTYTATAGSGTHLNGRPPIASAKENLGATLTGTGQARPGETDTFRRIGDSVTAMLTAGLVVRVSVPATLQLIHVAAGRMDASASSPTSTPASRRRPARLRSRRHCH